MASKNIQVSQEQRTILAVLSVSTEFGAVNGRMVSGANGLVRKGLLDTMHSPYGQPLYSLTGLGFTVLATLRTLPQLDTRAAYKAAYLVSADGTSVTIKPGPFGIGETVTVESEHFGPSQIIRSAR